MKIFYFLTLILCVFLLAGCNSNTKTFKLDVPPDGMGKGSLFESLNFIRDSLGLNTLERGYDSLQIRIWSGNPLVSNQQLIVLKNQKGIWKALFYQYKHYNQKGDSLISFEKFFTEKKPDMSWDDLIRKLYSDQILTLPDYRRIKGYEIPAFDGNAIIIEISTKKTYRLFSYPSPQLAQRFIEARNIEGILMLLNSQLDIRL